MFLKLFTSYCLILFFLISCQRDPVSNSPVPSSSGAVFNMSGMCDLSRLYGKYVRDSLLNDTHYFYTVINVIIPGTYEIYTDTVNGIYFRSTGTFDSVGRKPVKLMGYGKPLSTGVSEFIVHYDSSACMFRLTTLPNPFVPTNTGDSTTLFFGSRDGYFYAVNATSGTVKWRYPMGLTTTPALSDTVVYAPSLDHNLYALNAKTGRFKWTVYTGGWNGNEVQAPFADNGRVYFTCNNMKAYSIDTTLSCNTNICFPQTKWIFTASNEFSGQINASVVKNGTMFFGVDTTFYAIEALSGIVKWKTIIPEWCAGNSPSVIDGVVYLTGGVNAVYALNAQTGHQIWKYTIPLALNGGTKFSSPTVANGTVYFALDSLAFVTGQLCALDAASGMLKWKSKIEFLESTHRFYPVTGNGLVYCPSYDGYINAWDATNGRLMWRHPIPEGASILLSLRI